METDRVTAGLAREEDVDRILEINQLEYGPSDVLVTREDFAWRYEQNPAGRAVVAVIRDSLGEVVGFIWVVPLRLRLQGRDCPAATGTNLLIHPQHRNGFAYAKLIRRFERVFEENSIPVHFSFVSEGAYQRQRRGRPQTVSTIPLLLRPLNVETLAQTHFTNRWQRFLISGAGRLLAHFLFHRKSAASLSDIAIQSVAQFGDDFDEFWRQSADRYPVMVIRDRAFLAWRFAGVSGREYRILVARAEERMLGYVVLRCALIRGLPMGLIMDFLVASGPAGEAAGLCLLAEAEAYLRGCGVAGAAGLMVPVAVEYGILRRAGYRPLPAILAPRIFRFALYGHGSSDLVLNAMRAQDWFVTLADYESY